MHIIALDIGDKRIGVAVSEPNFKMAMPYETYTRKNLADDCMYFSKLAKQRNASVIVCGMPYNDDGTDSYQSKKTRRFIEELAKYTDVKIDIFDERYTTMQASSLLLEADMSRNKRKKVIDKIAASYILENYLLNIKESK